MASDDVPGDATVQIRGSAPSREKPPTTATRRHEFDSRYDVIETLGVGGMGEVLGARDAIVGREVAIKRMLEPDASSSARERFLREARIQGTLDHRAIPPVYDLSHDLDGRPYFVMKRLRGTTLSRLLTNAAADPQPTQVEPLLRAFTDVCLAVALAHSRGIIHRDLKPSNIMLGAFGEVYVLDWGVAKVTDSSDPLLEEMRSDSLMSDGMTQQGAVIGTPGYMAPEQASGAEIDERVDVFALGCILFQILTFDRSHQHAGMRPSESAPDRGIPPELDDACAAALVADRNARLSSAKELGERVQKFLDGNRDHAQRLTLASASLARATESVRDGGVEARRVAMREAGRAMALAPDLAGAAELVGRLMLELPAVVPPEVDATIRASEEIKQTEHARVTMFGYLSLSLFLPGIVWSGIRDARYVAAFAAMILVLCGVAAWNMRSHTRIAQWGLVILNAAMLALISRMFSPLLFAPGLAILTMMFMMGNPAFRRDVMPYATIAVTLLATVGVWGLELAGVLDRTVSFSPSTIEIHVRVAEISPLPLRVGIAVFLTVVVVNGAAMSYGAARRESVVQRQLALQAWQLRQLLPAL